MSTEEKVWPATPPCEQLNIVLNWFEDLRQLVPGPR